MRSPRVVGGARLISRGVAPFLEVLSPPYRTKRRAEKGRKVEQVGPGDVVWIPPLVRHWHGATADEAMTHFAVAEALEGTSVTWMEKGSDEDYAAAQAID